MMENKINQSGVRAVYEPVAVRVTTINPTGVLCQSGGVGASFTSYETGSNF